MERRMIADKNNGGSVLATRLLVIGPDGREVAAAVDMAAAAGAAVRRVADASAALASLRGGRGADLAFADLGCDVPGLLKGLRAERFHLPVVAFGIDAVPAAAVAAIRAGARDFLPLPPDPELIAAMLQAASAPERELVFASAEMAAVLDLARQFAPADASVLITGESGTGKEMVARFLHAQSLRAEAPFVSLNCAAIPENLLESELFGHEKGAFTGAVARRIGKFEEASGGTLLLDEVTEMDPRLQAKLLRAIQEREIDRVGGTKPVKIDIRLLATSNRDMEAAVTEGRFREDLYFRLNVLTLQLPPLRARPADLPPLADFFARKYALANGRPVLPLDPSALRRLAAHNWRGNVRELENCLHRAVLLAKGEAITAADIVLGGKVEAAAAAIPVATPAPQPAVGRSLGEVERDLIIDTLEHTLGNRTHAATILGISIRTLRNKLKQYGDAGVAVRASAPSGAHG
jgi:two-component system, response regulator FlrC